MSLFFVSVLSACTILLPFSVSIIRWDRVRHTYLPLMLLFCVGILNEIISYFFIRYRSTNNINGNLYVLIDFLLVLWLFKKLSVTLSKRFMKAILILGSIVWVLDNFIINTPATNNSLFRMVASLFIVIITTDKLNQLFFLNRPYLNRNTDLLLCIGILSYYAYKAFVEAFNVFPMPIDRSYFYSGLWVILGIINIVMNLLFTAAILCIPPKQAFIIRLS